MKYKVLNKLSVSDLESIGCELVQARKESGLTQREFAELLGLKEQQIQRWERSKYESIQLSNLKMIYKALKVLLSVDSSDPKDSF